MIIQARSRADNGATVRSPVTPNLAAASPAALFFSLWQRSIERMLIVTMNNDAAMRELRLRYNAAGNSCAAFT
jgi:hypothetical protein